MIFKELLPSDIRTARSFLSQLVDVLQEDISGSTSRKKYQQFVTGGVGPGITSSLFHEVYDQDYTLQTANPIFDVTFGLNPAGTTVATSQTSTDSAGKELFPSSSLMMREKMDIYRQFAQALLGDSSSSFYTPYDSTDAANKVDCAVFFAFKRLFARDSIKRETFAMRWYQTASNTTTDTLNTFDPATSPQDLYRTSIFGSSIYTDVGSSTNKITAFGGQVGNLVDASDTSRNVGLVFYDRGIVMLNFNAVISASQMATGSIDAMTSTGTQELCGPNTETYGSAKFIPDFVVSASMDNILDHICYSRLQSGSLTAMTFQNTTNINSTLVFCRLDSDEFNYSSNPTYVDANNRIVVIDEGSEDVQSAFSYISGIGLYDANDNLLAMGKLSRPVEKNNERSLTFRVRLDFVKKTHRIHVSV